MKKENYSLLTGNLLLFTGTYLKKISDSFLPEATQSIGLILILYWLIKKTKPSFKNSLILSILAILPALLFILNIRQKLPEITKITTSLSLGLLTIPYVKLTEDTLSFYSSTSIILAIISAVTWGKTLDLFRNNKKTQLIYLVLSLIIAIVFLSKKSYPY